MENYFSYFSTKTYVVGTQKNHLTEMVLMSTKNACLKWWIIKYSHFYAEKLCLTGQASKYLKIGTCPTSQKNIGIHKNFFYWLSLEISKFSLALQPEALVNRSGQVLFLSPAGPLKNWWVRKYSQLYTPIWYLPDWLCDEELLGITLGSVDSVLISPSSILYFISCPENCIHYVIN